MSRGRPFVPRLVALLPAMEVGRSEEWARAMHDAGVDGLAVHGEPADPVVLNLLTALRAVAPLPLELHFSGGLPRVEGWREALAGTGVDWVVPVRALPREAARDLEELGVGVAWPLRSAPDHAARVHATTPVPTTAFSRAPDGAERSLSVEPPSELVTPMAVGADTLVLPGESLPPPDPGAAVFRWRGVSE